MTLVDNTVLRHRDLERFNFAPDSRSFDCKFIEPGIISYRDQGGGIELLKKETIDRCMDSVIGNPLTIGHVMVTAENRMDVEHGIIQSWYFNSADGWYYVKGVVDTPRAKALIPVKRPSCGYGVVSFGPGGTYHGIRYDQEITNIKFNHLAIVDKPRYEDATFRLNTIVSNPDNMNVFKFLKKIVTRENGADGKPVDSTKEESTEIPASTEVEIDGKMVRLNDLADVWMKQTAAAAVSRANGDDEVEIDGKRVKMNELVDCYKKNSAAVRANEATNVVPAGTNVTPVVVEKPVVKPADNAFFTLHAARDNAAANAIPVSTNSGLLPQRTTTLAFLSQAMNQFVQAPILGLVDLTPSPNVVTCQINPDSSAPSIQVGDAVKLIAGTSATILVDRISGPTDGPVYGVIPYNAKKNVYLPGDLIEVATNETYVHLKTLGTVTRGEKVSVIASTTTADPTVSTAAASTDYITGVSVDTAATGLLTRIRILPSVDAPA